MPAKAKKKQPLGHELKVLEKCSEISALIKQKKDYWISKNPIPESNENECNESEEHGSQSLVSECHDDLIARPKPKKKDS